MSKDKLNTRTSKMMQRTIEEAIENKIKNKRTFTEEAVSSNIHSILDYVEGHKSLRDFMRDLHDNVDWIYMTPEKPQVSDKISEGAELNIQQNFELDKDIHKKVKAVSRCTDLQKSSVVRLCIIKQLYEDRESLSRYNERQVSEVWLNTKRDLKINKKLLVSQLYLNLHSDLIYDKIGRPEELKNLMNMCDIYNKFKDSKGHKFMVSLDDGKKVVDVFKEIEESIDY